MALNLDQARIVNPVLTDAIQGFIFPKNVGIALFPAVPVFARGGQIVAFGKEAFQQYNIRRAPGGATKRIDIGYKGDPFVLVQDSVEAKVPFEILQDAERVPHVNLANQYMRTAMQIVSLGLEVDQAEIALNASNYSANNKIALSGTDKWSDSSSNPTPDTRTIGAMHACRKAVNDLISSIVIPSLSGDPNR